MDEVTVKGIDDELNARICRLAEREGISVDEAVLKLIRKGADLPEKPRGSRTIGESLDHLIGTMTPEEAAELREALQHFETVDESMWR